MYIVYRYTKSNTDPEEWVKEATVGNSRYLLVDARDTSYHPVFGVE